MKKVLIIPLIIAGIICMSPIDHIDNSESGSSVRAKINAAFDSIAEVKDTTEDIRSDLSVTNSKIDTLLTPTTLKDSIDAVEQRAQTYSDNFTETDPIYTASQAANIDATDITNLGNLSGTNTGDQDLSSYATKTDVQDSITKAVGDTTEVDPVFTASQAFNISSGDITNLGNLSGTNTGDQDGSETHVTAGSNVTVSGTGTSGDPYVVNSSASVSPDSSWDEAHVIDTAYIGFLKVDTTGQFLAGNDTINIFGIRKGSFIYMYAEPYTDATTASVNYADSVPANETDPIYSASQAANITSDDITNLGNLSGTNTGDQTLPKIISIFGLGSGQSFDTLVFSANALAGSFRAAQAMVVDSFNAVLIGTSPDIDINFYSSTDLSDGSPDALNSTDFNITNTTTGDSFDSFNGTTTIPVNSRFWCTITAVTTKPTYLEVTVYVH